YGCGRAIHWINDIYYGLFQHAERMDVIAKAMIFHGLISFLAFSITLYLTHNILWAGVSYASGALLVLSACIFNALSESGLKLRARITLPDPSRLLNLIWVSLPMGIVASVSSLSTFVPQYQLEHHVGKSALGVYAALSYVAYMGQTVTGALSQSASPRLARYFAEGNIEAFKRLLRILLLIAVGLGSALLLLNRKSVV